MPLNPSEKSFFKLLAQREAANPSKPLGQQSLEEFRQGSLLEFAGKPADVKKADSTIIARDGYSIPIRIFNSDIKIPGPVFILFLGGGYVINTFEETAIAASRIAKFSGIKVIVINYRLTPENPMPTPINDAFDATQYIATHPDEFQSDPSKLSVGGLSAGAHCAAVISYLSQNDAQFSISQQILLNGAFDALMKKREYAEYEAQDLMVSREAVNRIYQLWDLSEEQLRSPIYSPYYAEDISRLPKTTMLIGEFDGMRSDSEAYFKKLQKSNCQVSKKILSGQCHHTLLLQGVMNKEEDPAKDIAGILRNH
uniref:Putative alpha/beta hydrolase n=1 Tax=uncultured organism TaxID=155900 RepID=A0A8A1V6C0_9ZZZZ|nr:putative alpha/beta hydrolase [uncultured organism]